MANGALSGDLRSLELPRRVYVDFAGVVPRVPHTIPVDRAGVHQIRVALNSRRPAITRLVFDLEGPSSLRVDRNATGHEWRLTVAAPPGSPTAVGPAARTSAASATAYVEWFGTTADRVAQLLGRSASPQMAHDGRTLAQLQQEWTEMPRHVQGMMPARGFEAEHELLLAAVRLGQVAMQRRADAARLAAEAAAGEVGATMLVARARAQLIQAGARVAAAPR